MARMCGSRSDGDSFSILTKVAVWLKAQEIIGFDPDKYKKDACGNWIQWDQYGVTVPGGTGWETDHIVPVAVGGGDYLSNLQPLQWENNRAKGDDWPRWYWAR